MLPSKSVEQISVALELDEPELVKCLVSETPEYPPSTASSIDVADELVDELCAIVIVFLEPAGHLDEHCVIVNGTGLVGVCPIN